MSASRTRLLGTLAVAALALTACGDEGSTEAEGGAELVEDGTLVVAMSGEFQPFSYFEGSELTGFDYDIGVAVAGELGLEMQSETAAFASLIGGVQANRYDVLIASMTPTEERAEAVDFTDGYYSAGAQAFVQAGSNCTEISEMDNPSVGVATGTTYQTYLEEEGGDWVGDVRSFDSDVVALRDLGTGRLDAVVTDRLVGLYQINEANLDIVTCGDPLYVEEPAFAVKKGNTGLVEDLNEALATIIENGTYAELSEQYFGQDIWGQKALTTPLSPTAEAERVDFLRQFGEYAPLFLEATWVTLSLTAVALLMAMAGGGIVAAMAMSKIGPLRWFAVAYIGLVRGTPLITQIFIIYFGLAYIVTLPAFWAGALALGFHNSAYIAEIIRSGFQAVPKGLTEAARSVGMSKVQTLRRVQGPLALRTTLPVLGNQYIIAVKDSSLVAFIGMQELFRTSQNMAASTYQPLTAYAIVAIYYLAIVLVLTAVVNGLERRLSKHRRPAAA